MKGMVSEVAIDAAAASLAEEFDYGNSYRQNIPPYDGAYWRNLAAKALKAALTATDATGDSDG